MSTRASGTSHRARWALKLVAVPAIVAGILAMHFLTGLPPLSHQTHVVSSAASAEHGLHAFSPMIDDCSVQSGPEPAGSGPCAPGHQMAAAACLLVMLVGLWFVAASRRSVGWLASRAAPVPFGAAARGLAPRHPPSLIVLSISRT